MQQVLTSEAVDAIMKQSLYGPEELPIDGTIPEGTIVVEGLVRNFGLLHD